MYPKFQIIPIHVQEQNAWQIVIWFSPTYGIIQDMFYETEIDAKAAIDKWHRENRKEDKLEHIRQPLIEYNPRYLH